ncbi:Mediator of RNA polymerase II transcription subunit 6 [Zalaria obscura]|uniref:Mediator of RNA polymerase II transcription subunit 6 n=1 Tax=Zalaria obscura TaxID=2024903 RepID=A0ACC3S7F4_9PEZI
MSRGGLRHLSRNFVHLGSFRDGVDVSGRRYPHLISALQLGFSCHLAAAAVTSRRQLRLWKWLYTICAGHSQTAGQFTERLQLPTSPRPKPCNMAKTYNNSPLDELQFRRPEVIAYWQGVHANSVHPIIRESPFFDHTSKNGLLWGQAERDMRLWQMVMNREAFETQLRSMNGVEYMIVGEPQPVEPGSTEDTGIWVIRKQDRRKRPNGNDEITVLGTYYLVGENMYQAPSVYDIVGNHLLSISTSLSKFINKASPLPLFTPAIGHTYYPPAPPKQTAGASQQALSQTSREGSLAPSDAVITQQSRAGSVVPGSRSAATEISSQATDPRDTYALYESFDAMLRYGDEYMDENPLRGEPGNFVFSSTQDRVRARQAEAEAAAARAKEEKEAAIKAEEERKSRSKEASPAASETRAGSPIGEQKAKKPRTDRIRRRKSKSNISPTTPNSPASDAPTSAS